jgi:hypothetical protein
MRASVRALVLGAGIAIATVAAMPRAEACGGCFVPPGPSTQVSAHRMAFAVSNTRTILWDQIQYAGAPESFGWVLPIGAKVDVGVSSDELFQRLESTTQPQITPPPCDPEHVCRACGGMREDDPSAAGGLDYGAPQDAGVSVWGTSVVGPYEATQLSATDGTALRTWLGDHGYVLPPAIAPVVDAYIAEGFGFLAIKLVPKADTSRMVPIRIAFDGASPTLPLRMVAAGTGSVVGLKLWVFGEGRWEAKNFPNGEIATKDLVWDYGAMASNFGTLENDFFTKAPRTWVTETSDDFGRATFFSGLPLGTTTTDAGTTFAKDTDESEIEKAFPGRTHLMVTRMFAQLPQGALNEDLQLQASLGARIPVSRQAQSKIGNCGVVYDCCSNGGVFECSTAPSPSDGSTSRTYTVIGSSLFALLAFGTARKLRRTRP